MFGISKYVHIHLYELDLTLPITLGDMIKYMIVTKSRCRKTFQTTFEPFDKISRNSYSLQIYTSNVWSKYSWSFYGSVLNSGGFQVPTYSK